MTTPNELYAMTPESTTNDVFHLVGFSYNHVPEISDDLLVNINFVKADRVDIEFLKNWNFDFRRVWILATVWFDGKPVMIIQNAGREGDDHSRRFITDSETFFQMISYIRTLLVNIVKIDNKILAINADEHNARLTEFYGNKLDGYFEKY